MAFVPTECVQAASTQTPQCLTPFWIDVLEVSNAQFIAFNGQVAVDSTRFRASYMPRQQISQQEARNFCLQREGYLPSEAEWQYAADRTLGLRYPWGNEIRPDAAVYGMSFAGGRPAEVGIDRRPRGAAWSGALDMSGNVWEWTDTTRELTSVLRGGAWYNAAGNVTVHSRLYRGADSGSDDVGFRCAGHAEAPSPTPLE